MVQVGDEIEIENGIKATVTALFQKDELDTRYIIGYRKEKNNNVGFFIEGDYEFRVLQ